MERILGSFEARQANTWTADVQYQLFVSAERAVGVRTGGQFAGLGRQALTHQFGLLGALVEVFLKKREARRKAEQVNELERCTMSELLTRHPKNFELPLHAVKRARIERVRFSWHGPAVARLVVELQNREPQALLLQSGEQLEACRALLGEVLAGRLVVDPKLGPSPRVQRGARTG